MLVEKRKIACFKNKGFIDSFSEYNIKPLYQKILVEKRKIPCFNNKGFVIKSD